MKKRTEGAWIIHHTKKLQDIRTVPDFEDIELAGKCGLFLSSLAASDEESTLSKAKVDAIAEANNINRKLELPIILQTLSDAQLIDVSKKEDLTVLGITTSNVLSHTSEIFRESGNTFQKAALELTNYSSEAPLKENILQEYIADYYKLDKKTNLKLFQQAEETG